MVCQFNEGSSRLKRPFYVHLFSTSILVRSQLGKPLSWKPRVYHSFPSNSLFCPCILTSTQSTHLERLLLHPRHGHLEIAIFAPRGISKAGHRVLSRMYSKDHRNSGELRHHVVKEGLAGGSTWIHGKLWTHKILHGESISFIRV